MSHEKLDVLLSEINRQIDLASKSSQNIPASSYQSAGELFIQNQDHSYYHDLKDWCLTLAPNDKTNWEDIVLPPNCRNCLWKLLAFSNSSSAVIDPEYQQARCRDLQAVQRRGDLNDGQTEDIWQAAGLLSWATSAESSMVIVQGTSQTIRCLEQFSYEVSHQLAEIYPTIWMLSEPSSRELFAERDETELLRQLAVQALRQISCFKAGFLVDSLHLFKECRTNHDWFQILLTIVQLIPKLYVVLDLSILEGRINDAKNWAHDFHTLISQLKSGCSSKLSVMLLSSRPLSRGNSSAPVISVTSQSRQLSRPRPRKRPFENSSTGSIRCLSTLLSMREMQETRRKRKLVSSPRVERETHDPTFQASASIYSLRGVDVPGDTRPSRQDDDPSKGTLNSIISTGTSPTPPHRNDITIAIICALPLEADAVLSTFDHHWDIQLFSRMEGDKNAYSVGRIGCHDVVLVHMPGMGRTPAATVTASCRTSFPGIRLALVVGICGAVPFHRRSTEVLLGDVIISDRLVIYDFGRQFPDKFMRKEETNDNARKPPEEIMGFLAKIKGQMHLGILHDRAGIHLEALLQSGSPPHPGLKEDRLFESSYRHKHQTPSECVQCASLGPLDRAVCDTARTSTCDTLGCDLTKLVVRQRHSHIMSGVRNRLPVIHFGAYASGDTVMKSGEHRDQIAAKEEIIAFEMEGAGAWEIFPCIIIKGVCDYADSHKNKKWQGYAAVTAAACLKALLEVWQPAIRRATHSDP
ncbi:putative pfs domain-containing protein [Rosellinia necatrix]|uniref:Putative pfs domain-containing protein n=1 Tax=Rosellinia necatrix TaxID=77044 RepID=A0A1W2TN38_ROSNE|nr:putative pfs domain-containing protein [Rosellinia necatrix]